MIGNIIVYVWIAMMLIGGYFDFKENAVRRKDPRVARLQKTYARRRKEKWQPLPKHPKMPKRPGRFDLEKVRQPSQFLR